MQFLNLNVPKIRTEVFIHQHADVATWLKLISYCAEKENGGFIRDAAKWSPHQWGLIGLLSDQVHHDSQLWRFECGHLRVSSYPKDQEESCKAKRRGALATNRKLHPKKVIEMPAKYSAGAE